MESCSPKFVWPNPALRSFVPDSHSKITSGLKSAPCSLGARRAKHEFSVCIENALLEWQYTFFITFINEVINDVSMGEEIYRFNAHWLTRCVCLLFLFVRNSQGPSVQKRNLCRFFVNFTCYTSMKRRGSGLSEKVWFQVWKWFRRVWRHYDVTWPENKAS